ncbi:class I SAM-dependent methyltransferase [Paracoccus aminophilus]|uniref:Methyltransferase n=1 Tax=Paracoccus aminophilus JCM 7686 TaxID=1367847 RepID=S5XQJ9_PARAH|nr:class I SAM-dependent methyltransferase [Paracoccus aminophilus]AGT09659.1 methyltransferase [Paracoccus aminophilus JCM 7686]
MDRTDNGWETSAAAWIADMGERGDFSRIHVLDAPMLARIRGRGFQTALDVGSGEGRFCRMMQAEGIAATGVEPTPSLRAAAEARDPAGNYVDAQAEALPFDTASFDLVVSYLTLIDIDGIEPAIAEMARVLKPGGSLLIANLNSFSTAGDWHRLVDGSRYFRMDNYLEARAEWMSWRGVSIRNWHRPMQDYMRLLIGAGLRLSHFEEPSPTGGDRRRAERFSRVPYFHVMEWLKD